MILRYAFLAFVVSGFASISLAGITIESEVKYEQEIFSGTLTGGIGPIAADISQTYNTANATYTFETNTAGTSPFELKSQAKLGVDIDGRGANNPGWQSVTASSRAVGGLVDTAIIDGVPGQVGGFIEFLWFVTGTSDLELTPKLASDAYFINEFSSLAILSSSEGGGAFTEVYEHNPQAFGNSIQSTAPAISEQQVFAVDWFAGQDFDVFFQLATVARLDIAMLDAAGFEANMDVDFGNTAVLTSIRIFDNDGNILPDATLISKDPAGPVYADLIAVPEPSGAMFFLMLFTFTGGIRYWRKSSESLARTDR